MEASSAVRRLRASADVRDWAWWRLPLLLRSYIGIVVAVVLAVLGLVAAQTAWTGGELLKYLLLLGCGLVSVAATARVAYPQSGLVRDFLSTWVLPVAILLPPVFAMVTPVPLLIVTQWRVHRGVVYRRVFTGAAIGVAYGVASLIFHAIPASVAGPGLGSGWHALTWAACVAGCEIIGWAGHSALLVTAVRLSDPTASVADLYLNREALLGDFAQFDLGIVITVLVAVQPVLAVFGVPTVLLARRFIMHPELLAQSRTDPKTGLLNAATWEREAEAEIARAVRTRSPLSLALLDIDHFKLVNDTHGHLAGDQALRALTTALRDQLRSYDLAGRFGGEEFVVLLPQTHGANAMTIAERLRNHIAAMSVPVTVGDPAGIRLTVSIGVATLDETSAAPGKTSAAPGKTSPGLSDLIAAADMALYDAKQAGRNRTRLAATGRGLAGVAAAPAARPAPVTAAVPEPSPDGAAPLVPAQRQPDSPAQPGSGLPAADQCSGGMSSR